MAMQPWFGPRSSASDGPSVDELCAAFWGGEGFDVREFLSVKQEWAMAKPVGMPAASAPGPALGAARWQSGHTDTASGTDGCRAQGVASGEALTVWVEGRNCEGRAVERGVRAACLQRQP